MAHATRIKVKRNGKFVDVEDLPDIRESERKTVPMPKVNINRLPKLSALDKDVPFSQLFFEHPEVRAYVTEEGNMRMGLTPKAQKKAEQILERYGGKP